MSKIVFIVPSIRDSHCRNRIMEFLEHGYEVSVFGFSRTGLKKTYNLPYKYTEIGELKDKGYKERIGLYYKAFKKLRNEFSNQNVLFYLNGLDIALFFHYIYPKAKYIYEECDLTHTYLGFLKYPLEWLDKIIIKKSLLSVTTSEGFIEYHFGGKRPKNVILVENKLNPSIIEYPTKSKRTFSRENISFGFVGGPRFDSVYNFIDVFCKNFPEAVFHVYGGPVTPQFQTLAKYPNCIFHGFFNNPSDLPSIYKNLDLVISTYDTKFDNVKYAEPNKIYESIYFETPIVVSSGTFLARKVKRLGIGYDIDAMDDRAIVEFVNSLRLSDIEEKIQNAKKIDKKQTLNINDELFERLDSIIEMQ